VSLQVQVTSNRELRRDAAGGWSGAFYFFIAGLVSIGAPQLPRVPPPTSENRK